MNDDLELSRLLTGVVASVEGVGDIYPSGTLAATVARTVVNAITKDQTDDTKVCVSRDGSGRLAVTATIGVAHGHSARETVTAVSNSLRAYLETSSAEAPAPLIDVKVSRIETESRTVQPHA